MAIRVRALGELIVEGIDLGLIRSRKARTALTVLVVGRGRPVSVARLVECLWPDGDLPRDPEREVAVNLSRVRAVLGRERITRTDAGYRLEVDWLDLDELDDLAAEAHRRLRAGDHAAARAAATGALSLVRGPLLADQGEAPWLDLDRAALDRTLTDLSHVAAEAALAVGDLGEAARLAEKCLTSDSYDESAVRVLMKAHSAAGRAGSALSAYAAMRDRLLEDLGASPSPETADLHLAILVENERSPAGSAVPAEAALRPAASALPGRKHHLEQLWAAHRDASGGLELVVVEGDPGAGKTRLVETFLASAAGQGTPTLVGRCDELGRALPLQPVADALASHLHAAGSDGRADALGDEAETLAPLVGLRPRPAIKTESVPGPGMTADAMQTYVFAALLRTLTRIGATTPAVLTIDDVHLAGASTTEWLRFCVRRRVEFPLLIVVTMRPGEGRAIAGTRRIVLEPLDLDTVREIVGPERAEVLHDRSGGNPLLLVELAGAETGKLPESVRDAVADRLREAGTDLADTIRTAAIIGPQVDLDLLAAVLERPALGVLADLEGAVQRRFLEERGDRFVFRHALVRESLVATTSVARQALVHRQAALAMAGRRDIDHLVLAHHARLGGERVLAADALASAADLATWRYDLEEAERLLDDALVLDPRPALHLARGKIRVARSNLDGADADGESAGREAAKPEALALRAWVARHRHDMESAIRLGTEGARSALDRTTRASCLLVVAMSHRGLGDLAKADQHLAEAMAGGFQGLGLQGWLGVLRVHQGRPTEALDLLEPAVGVEADIVHGFWVEHVLQMVAHAHGMQGHPERALAVLDRLTTETHRRGSDVRYQGLDDNYRAWILCNLGDPSAGDLNAGALDAASLLEPLVQATLDQAITSYLRGDLDTTNRLVGKAISEARPTWFSNRWRCEQRADFLHALVCLSAGEIDAALTTAEALLQAARSRGDHRYSTLAELMVQRAHHRGGRDVRHDEVAAVLARLPEVAGMEAWWLTAETASEFDVDRWWVLAEARVAALAAESGDRRHQFMAHASDRLAKLGRR